MIDVAKILEYTPVEHGEHGVDSVIHRKIRKSQLLFESYSNPPGASWSEIIIQNPVSGDYFSWDHVPRNPKCAKRPDAVIQFNHNNTIHLLVVESKRNISQIYDDVDALLKNFFIGNSDFHGLFNRPVQHRKNDHSGKWEYIGDRTESDAYWIQKIRNKIKIYSGFAFGFEPEFYKKIHLFDWNSWNTKMKNLSERYSLDVVIGVGWHQSKHMPFVKIVGKYSFLHTRFYDQLRESLV